MPNIADLFWGLVRRVKEKYQEWEAECLSLQALKLVIDMLKEKRL